MGPSIKGTNPLWYKSAEVCWLNGAELIYTTSGSASKHLKYKTCLFDFSFFFKPFHFYYHLKETLKCLLVKKTKYFLANLIPFIPLSSKVIVSVAEVIFLPVLSPSFSADTSINEWRKRSPSSIAEEMCTPGSQPGCCCSKRHCPDTQRPPAFLRSGSSDCCPMLFTLKSDPAGMLKCHCPVRLPNPHNS